MAEKRKLTAQEQSFVLEFVKDLNPVLACERLGYDELLAAEVAYELLGKDYIKDAMAEALCAPKKYDGINSFVPKDFGVTENYIMLRLKSIADRAGKPAEQLKALELLGKTIGMFKDSLKIDQTVETRRSAFSAGDREKLLASLKASGRA